jgi:hypothetical protein
MDAKVKSKRMRKGVILVNLKVEDHYLLGETVENHEQF